MALPNHRTIHASSTPKLGGLSIYLAFMIALAVYLSFGNSLHTLWGLILGGSAVLLVGLFDDVRGLSCYRKLLGQVLAALLAVYFGFSIETIGLPNGSVLHLGLWAYPVSILWIVSITNAVNLLDGLDGLATGFAIIVSSFLGMAALVTQNFTAALASFVLLGAVLGFFRYNFPYAKIFLGDMGSLFLGFVLACLSLKVFTWSGSSVNVMSLLCLFMIPFADTGISVVRRISNGRHPFWADRKHIHHRLIDSGKSPRTAVLIIFAGSFLYGITSLLFLVTTLQIALLFFIGLSLVFVIALVQLNCFDFFFNNAMFRKLRYSTTPEER
ncbi:MAG: MraY family glycosyltransferase [bacterium]